MAEADEQFIAAIVAAPDQDEPRLIYADWFEEHGDVRAEYLRAELEYSRTYDSDLQERLVELLPEFPDQWLNRCGIRFDFLSLDERFKFGPTTNPQSLFTRIFRPSTPEPDERLLKAIFPSISFGNCHELFVRYTRGKAFFRFRRSQKQDFSRQRIVSKELHVDAEFCPICKHNLRTNMAKQCFYCGADWH